MENINNKTNSQEVKEEAVIVKEAPAAEKSASSKYTLDYALEQLEKVREEEKAFAAEILKRISEVQTGVDGGDIGAQSKGMALEALANQHGQTSRKLIDFYLEMVNELKPPKEPKTNRTEFLDFVKDCTASAGPGGVLPDFEKIWNTMFR